MADIAYTNAMSGLQAPADSLSEHGGATRRTQRSNRNSALRRSLTLTQGAAALITRRFSRSAGRARSSNSSGVTTPAMTTTTTAAAPETAEEDPLQRGSTISTTSPDTPRSLHVRIVPSIENPSRSLIFEIVDRELEAGTVIKIGRFAERSQSPNHMSFKSKVVSRSHCELWVHTDGKLYIRDTKSSSGTFLNHVRLSPANQESPPTEIKHGDIVQLGVDYQGGQEEIYRSVKMRFEINASRKPRPLSFSISQFNNLKNLSRVASSHAEDGRQSSLVLLDEESEKHPPVASDSGGDVVAEVDECCICLYALAPFQALFVAPCSHSYHFKCIRVLLQSYPGFQCPICRTYSDLEASVAIEPEEVMQKYGLRCKSFTPPPEAAFGASHQQVAMQVDDAQQPATSTCLQPITNSSLSSSSSSSSDNNAADSDQQDRSSSDEPHNTQPNDEIPSPSHDTTSRTSSGILVHPNTSDLRDTAARDRRTVFVSDDMDVIEIQRHDSHHSNDEPVRQDNSTSTAPSQREEQPITPPPAVQAQTPDTTRRQQNDRRLGAAANLMEKLKMTFFEKRKSTVVMSRSEQQRGRKRSNKARPLSYPNFLIRPFGREQQEDNDEREPESSNLTRTHTNHTGYRMSNISTASSSSNPAPNDNDNHLANTLSRQSTAHLAEIEEEDNNNNNNALQQHHAMAVDN